mmetsp:Transcript_14888/g.14355  ORF Transcript_14888/g.14355 Transcript_14888/m.14355 type:complete len:401 (-) Transcript_14888:22-1224(-)|eukprot:CAMPEP_0197826432 /NCGR_PEP_ID=MMETSP1437-20131217/3394_1 /TAXON_ID=49252 ORGANISM="Eucampia antarctica, Strain CCMP1452" /NCGR_SAMPLE_ID=MMETSP1437 /ASSEMBLY_ACC=CAM_ASM_001096 /LENGTH=400 /DNA_ID=CAMNT_0043426869 /DNA_START=13 /DNA_END=1215 /DNA_ORIENTATION=+
MMASSSSSSDSYSRSGSWGVLLVWVLAVSFVKDCQSWSLPIFAATAGAVSFVSSDVSSGVAGGRRVVAVAGATGRTGRYVVQELLERGVEVVALVRDEEKAVQMFADAADDQLLTVIKCDLLSKNEVTKATRNCDAAIWCATGFSSADNGMMAKFQSLFSLVTKRTIDQIGVPLLAQTINKNNNNNNNLPQMIMCSSAGVTRPSWDEDKKEAFSGCADIPIVRLNPFGILDLKRESEQSLRDINVPYCIVRPCGLQDDENVWKSNSRPVLSQGDVAVGRIHRKDVANILVDCCLQLNESTGKTFEVSSIEGNNYPPPKTLSPILQSMTNDSVQGEPYIPSSPVLQATYSALQQLLPGEKQDAAALAMGQTYEQLDNDQVGRLGERGQESIEEAGIYKPSS